MATNDRKSAPSYDAIVLGGVFFGLPVWFAIAIFWEPAMLALIAAFVIAVWFIGLTVSSNLIRRGK